jgi:hypothetical protein
LGEFGNPAQAIDSSRGSANMKFIVCLNEEFLGVRGL